MSSFGSIATETRRAPFVTPRIGSQESRKSDFVTSQCRLFHELLTSWAISDGHYGPDNGPSLPQPPT